MKIFATYFRALSMLRTEKGLSVTLVLSNIAIAAIQLAEPVLFGRVIDALTGGRETFRDIGLWAVLGLIGIAASVVVALVADRFAHRQRLRAMKAAFDRAIALPISYHAERGSGRIVRTMLAGTDILFALWLSFFREHVAAFVGIVFMVPTAIALNPHLAGILAVLAVVYTTLNVIVVRRTDSGQAAVERYNQNVFGQVGDVIGNVAVVQSYARFRQETSALRQLMIDLLDAQYPVLTWWAILTVMTRAASTVTMVAVLATGAVLSQRGDVTVGAIVSFVGFAALLIGRLDQLSSFVSRIFIQAPTLGSFFELLDTAGDIDDTPGKPPLQVATGRVVFDRVNFRYPASDQGIFDASFVAEAGETIALVGPTGSGKSTTLALLQRFRDPDSGAITIDGQDIRSVDLTSLRQAMAMVFQEAGLFNRSIAENILIGRPEATPAEVEAAAQLAEAHEFILRKPGGYGFVIGERGQALSGGERQRIAIARAVLKQSPILLLDEATSALDNETEAKIKRALDRIRRGRTTFIIAHRLSTVRDADQILVMDRGRIVETGRFDELARAGGLFQRLVSEGGFAQPEDEDAA
ncbi:glucan ABC transporter ATP-binding protein/ permease [Methylolobus aquaticus]